jgi:large subunit ribosomal protein L10
MANSVKTAAVAELADSFRNSNGAVLTEYRGLTVAQLKELRRSLGDHATYAVVKNTLTKIAADQAGIDGLTDLLVGPSAVAFVTGDPVEAARGLRDFAKANPHLVIKGGVLEGKPVTVDQINKMADLESREILLSKMAGALNASLVNAVTLFSAPLSQAARLVAALQAKREADGETLPVAEADETEAEAEVDETEAEAEVDETPVDEVAAPAEDATPADVTDEAAPAAEVTDDVPADEVTDEAAPAADSDASTV